jgi:hypothetical protein
MVIRNKKLEQYANIIAAMTKKRAIMVQSHGSVGWADWMSNDPPDYDAFQAFKPTPDTDKTYRVAAMFNGYGKHFTETADSAEQEKMLEKHVCFNHWIGGRTIWEPNP